MSEPTQRLVPTCPPELYAQLLEEQLLHTVKQLTAYRGAYLALEQRYQELYELATQQQESLEATARDLPDNA